MMLKLPVYSSEGTQVGEVQVDQSHLGGHVRHQLLKQAIVTYQSRKRLGTAATRSRGMVEGSTRKLYRQKGTGNARMGTVRTCIRRGGGVAFAKTHRDFGLDMPKRMRRLACKNAVLAKILGGDVLVVDQLDLEGPKTQAVIKLMKRIGAGRSWLLALESNDPAIYRSCRNIPKSDVRVVQDLNAYDVLRRSSLIFTKAAFEQLAKRSESAAAAS